MCITSFSDLEWKKIDSQIKIEVNLKLFIFDFNKNSEQTNDVVTDFDFILTKFKVAHGLEIQGEEMVCFPKNYGYGPRGSLML